MDFKVRVERAGEGLGPDNKKKRVVIIFAVLRNQVQGLIQVKPVLCY